MSQMGRSRARPTMLAIALALGLSLTLGVWASSGASTRSQVGLTAPTSSGIRAGGVPTGAGHPTRDAPRPSPGLADQLHGMDPAAVDRLAANEEAAARGGAPASTLGTRSWLVGEVGTYRVGRGVAPGTYESAGATKGKVCRWNVSGSDGTVVSAGSGVRRAVVTIHKTDRYFQTQDCSNWHRIP
jgi:hypothetical protein